LWANGFECCAGGGLDGIPHGIILAGDHVGPGLIVTNNLFRGGSIYAQPTTPGANATARGVLIQHNSFTGHGAGTRATQALTQTAASAWSFDFCAQLVFPSIARVAVEVVASAGFPRAVARPPVGCTVLVETDAPVTGTVTVTVDASASDPDFV
jgi:hypothetical protein